MHFLIPTIHNADKVAYYKIQQEVHTLVMKYLWSDLQCIFSKPMRTYQVNAYI